MATTVLRLPRAMYERSTRPLHAKLHLRDVNRMRPPLVIGQLTPVSTRRNGTSKP